MEPDFSGWATKAGLKCSDGRTIMPEAFKHMDGMTVPLVWQHAHDTPDNVLGHAILEAREDGVYARGFFNGTPAGQNAKTLVQHKDINHLSIYANKLVERSKQVFHGMIREVSLVLSGANPGAMIDYVALQHSDGSVDTLDDEAVIYTGLTLSHSADSEDDELVHAGERTVQDVFDEMDEEQQTAVHYMIGAALDAVGSGPDSSSAAAHDSLGPDATVQDVYDTLSPEQKDVVNYMIGAALEAAGAAQHSAIDGEGNLIHGNQEGNTMTRNVFEGSGTGAQAGPALSHSDMQSFLGKVQETAKRTGSLKEAVLAHAGEYGIQDIELLFPDAKNLQNTPELISRRQEWVSSVISGVKKSPFARIKTMSADITHEEARAKGYVKGNLKKEEWFGLQKRITTPTTIYKKQKLDRDDIIDITDLDVVAWLKGEMRLMLDEEIARAILIGDGRAVDDEDKVDENCIRPIAHDDDFYAHKVILPTNVNGDGLVEAILRARLVYRGSGTPTMYLTEALLTDLLLGKDKMGRRYYNSSEELKVALRVADLVTVDVMDTVTTDGGELLAVLVNLNDYTAGANQGGQVAMFDDFDIDYNQYKYLMETRMSGALTKFKSALVFSRAAGTLVNPTVPTFVPASGVVTVPNQGGVIYYNEATSAPLSAGAQPALNPGEQVTVLAQPDGGHYFPSNIVASWTFTRPAA
jgi:hypothetical protein